MQDTYIGLRKSDKEWLEEQAEDKEDESVSSLVRRLVVKAKIEYNHGEDPFAIE